MRELQIDVFDGPCTFDRVDDVSRLLVAYSSVAADRVEGCGSKPGGKASSAADRRRADDHRGAGQRRRAWDRTAALASRVGCGTLADQGYAAAARVGQSTSAAELIYPCCTS